MIALPVLLQFQFFWIASALSLVAVLTLIGWYRTCSFLRRRQLNHHTHSGDKNDTNGMTRIAFFHPYCTGGGGGERVLWKMMQVLGGIKDRAGSSSSFIHPTIIIYTIEEPSISYQQGKNFI
jgi:hypothetical protein